MMLLLITNCGGSVQNSQPSGNVQTSQSSGNAQNLPPSKLPSGKEIKITSVNKMAFKNSESALVLNYQTDIPVENKDVLRKEVDEIWAVFQKDVEAENLNVGIIRAVHVEGSGLVRNGKGYGFSFVKREDGQWHSTEDEKK